MGDDTTSKIKSIGDIWLQMHDAIIRDLTNVQYFLDIRNHISLGVLIGQRLHISLVDLDLKASKDALLVVKGA